MTWFAGWELVLVAERVEGCGRISWGVSVSIVEQPLWPDRVDEGTALWLNVAVHGLSQAARAIGLRPVRFETVAADDPDVPTVGSARVVVEGRDRPAILADLIAGLLAGNGFGTDDPRVLGQLHAQLGWAPVVQLRREH